MGLYVGEDVNEMRLRKKARVCEACGGKYIKTSPGQKLCPQCRGVAVRRDYAAQQMVKTLAGLPPIIPIVPAEKLVSGKPWKKGRGHGHNTDLKQS